MPNYIANGYLVHEGKVVQTGNEVELTDEQAHRLGDKVTPAEASISLLAETSWTSQFIYETDVTGMNVLFALEKLYFC